MTGIDCLTQNILYTLACTYYKPPYDAYIPLSLLMSLQIQPYFWDPPMLRTDRAPPSSSLQNHGHFLHLALVVYGTICPISTVGLSSPKPGNLKIWKDIFSRYAQSFTRMCVHVCSQCMCPCMCAFVGDKSISSATVNMHVYNDAPQSTARLKNANRSS